eukprot:1093083-Pelagomonas_calceolata.AAC.1
MSASLASECPARERATLSQFQSSITGDDEAKREIKIFPHRGGGSSRCCSAVPFLYCSRGCSGAEDKMCLLACTRMIYRLLSNIVQARVLVQKLGVLLQPDVTWLSSNTKALHRDLRAEQDRAKQGKGQR